MYYLFNEEMKALLKFRKKHILQGFLLGDNLFAPLDIES